MRQLGGRRARLRRRSRSNSRRDREPTKGGLLGTFPRGDSMEPSSTGSSSSLAPGEVSEVVRTEQGFHILRVDKFEPPGYRSLDEVAGADPRDALPEGGRGAVPGLALEGPARAALRSRCSTEPAIFREYDIRGIAERDFDAGLRAPARAAPSARSRPSTAPRCWRSGRDCRLTSDALRRGAARGHRRRPGVDVLDLGVCPTPLVYFAIVALGARRRRPGDRQPQPGRLQRLQALRRHAGAARRADPGPAPPHRGRQPSGRAAGECASRAVMPAYQDYVAENVGRLGAPDRAWWSTPATAPAARWRRRSTSGSAREVTSLFCDLDGRFPNHHPDPTVRREHAGS